MKERLKLNQQGLTLVELIIGLALASVIMAAIATFLVGNISFSNTAQEEIYIQGQVRNAMKVITDLAMDKGKYEIISPSHIALKKGITEIAFKCENGEIKYIDEANKSKVIARDIKKFEIKEKIKDKLFEVTIIGIKNEGKKKKEVSFELTNEIFLRN
jgi:prepilin-type N-terminal cleavage/methylation domain-containing protein